MVNSLSMPSSSQSSAADPSAIQLSLSVSYKQEFVVNCWHIAAVITAAVMCSPHYMVTCNYRSGRPYYVTETEHCPLTRTLWHLTKAICRMCLDWTECWCLYINDNIWLRDYGQLTYDLFSQCSARTSVLSCSTLIHNTRRDWRWTLEMDELGMLIRPPQVLLCSSNHPIMEQATSWDGQCSNTRLVQESSTLSCRAHQSIGMVSQWEFADYIPEPEPPPLQNAITILKGK